MVIVGYAYMLVLRLLLLSISWLIRAGKWIGHIRSDERLLRTFLALIVCHSLLYLILMPTPVSLHITEPSQSSPITWRMHQRSSMNTYLVYLH
jgi:hypothetical protein